jgi:pimeloyl-ACP methyl ester carboxylesterase
MGTPTRRAVLKGTAAFAGLAAAQASGLAPAAEAAPAGASRGHPTANVLLVQGAWVDGSSWSRVIAILQRRGHNVLAVQLPLTSLAEDVAWTRHVLAERLQGPTVLAGHSYGGAVIAGAATGVENVIGLVFASAFAPDEVRPSVNSGAGFRHRLGWPTPSLTRWAFCGSIRRRSRPTSPRTSRWRRRGSWPRCKSRSRPGPSPTRRGRRRGRGCRRGSWCPPRTG